MRRYAFEALVAHSIWFLFLFGFTDGFARPYLEWLAGFAHWDARWYQTLAQNGHGFLPQTYVFPPLNGSILGRITDVIFGVQASLELKLPWDAVFFTVAMTVGVSMLMLANTIFVCLSERRWKIARRTLWMIAVANPMAYFALTAYSDLLFFALLMLVLFLVTWTSPRFSAWNLAPPTPRQSRVARALLAGLLFTAPWIRLTGFAFGVFSLLKRREVAATFLSLATFLTYYWIRTGDPFFFLSVQKVFDMPEGHILSGFITTSEIAFKLLGSLVNGAPSLDKDFFLYATNFGLAPLTCLLLSISLTAWLLARREHAWALTVFAITLISHNQAFWRSTVRYTLPFFPMFFWMLLAVGENARPKIWRRIGAAIGIGLGLTIQVFYARLFQAGGWAF